jgi:hypothetical protein
MNMCKVFPQSYTRRSSINSNAPRSVYLHSTPRLHAYTQHTFTITIIVLRNARHVRLSSHPAQLSKEYIFDQITYSSTYDHRTLRIMILVRPAVCRLSKNRLFTLLFVCGF